MYELIASESGLSIGLVLLVGLAFSFLWRHITLIKDLHRVSLEQARNTADRAETLSRERAQQIEKLQDTVATILLAKQHMEAQLNKASVQIAEQDYRIDRALESSEKLIIDLAGAKNSKRVSAKRTHRNHYIA